MESSGVCVFRLANSGCASLAFDYFRPAAASTHGEDRVRIAGEKGVLEIAGGEASFFPRDAAPFRLEKEEPLSLFQEFVRNLEGGTPLRVTAADAFAITELALRCREAADKSVIAARSRT
jgi:predicted dehydrogenase